MAEEPKAGVTGEPEGEPKTSAAGEANVPVSEAEQELARLRTEVEGHRKTQSEWQSKVEEANRVLEDSRRRAQQAAPTATDTVPPIIAEIAERVVNLNNLITRYQGDPNNADYVAGLEATRLALINQAQDRMSRQREATLWNEAQTKIPDERKRSLAYSMVTSGRAGTLDDAMNAIEGQRMPEVSKELDAARKRVAELESAAKLREVDISVRGVPNDGRSPARGMPLDEWSKAMDAAKAAGDRKRMDELRRIAAAR